MQPFVSFALYCIVLRCIISLVSCTTYFIRVDAGTDVVYELIAEPVQKPFAGEPQPGEVVNQAPGETTNPDDLQGKPRCITLNFSIQ